MAAEPFVTEQRKRTRWKMRTARGLTAEAVMREQNAKMDLLLRRVGYIGERIRSMSAKFDGEMRRYRWCSLCCAAMAQEDSTEAMEARLALRPDRAGPSGVGEVPRG